MNTAAETRKFRKGDIGFYSNSAGTFRAKVTILHRDGSITVFALFMVDASGKDINGYLGFPYRMQRSDLRPSFAA